MQHIAAQRGDIHRDTNVRSKSPSRSERIHIWPERDAISGTKSDLSMNLPLPAVILTANVDVNETVNSTIYLENFRITPYSKFLSLKSKRWEIYIRIDVMPAASPTGSLSKYLPVVGS